MKILKIFGLVVGIHVVAFMFVFAIPGCRSTTRHSPPPPAAVQAERSPAASAVSYPTSEMGNPVSASSYSPPVERALNPGTASPSASVSFPSSSSAPSTVRFNPTRPGTPAANVLQTAPVADVTPATTYVVVSGDSLWKVAKKHNLSAKELAAANNLRLETPLREGQKILIPGKATPSSTNNPQPTGSTGDTLVYKVRAGDSLALIAKRAGTTTSAIKSLNHLSSDTVRAGQELTLPAGSNAASTLASSPEPEPTSTARTSGGGVHHIVRAGETLGQIAKRYGVTRTDISVANNIADPLKIRPGQDLLIPGGKVSNSPRTTPTPKPTVQQLPTPETPPASSPVSPIAAPVEENPIGAAPASAPPEVPIQDVNPIAAPK